MSRFSSNAARAAASVADSEVGVESRRASRVLFIHCGDNWIRGSEVALLTLLKNLNPSVIAPQVWCNQPLFATEVTKQTGIRTHVAGIPEIMFDGFSSSFRFELFGWAKAVAKLCALIRREKFDLIYCNSALPSQFASIAARVCRVPVLVHVHTPYNLRYILLYGIDRVPAVIFPSQNVSEMIRGKRKIRGQHRVVYCGVDTERYKPFWGDRTPIRMRLGLPPNAVVICQVGSLCDRKGVDILIEAFSRLSSEQEARLLLIGDGEQRAVYEALVRSKGISDRVLFVGDRPDVDELLRAVDVAVLCSRSEAFGISVIEAGACGIPAIVSRTGGLPETIDEGRSGFCFNPGDVEQLGAHLQTLVTDSELRERMGQEARKVTERRFSTSGYARAIEEMIAETLASSPQRSGRTRLASSA